VYQPTGLSITNSLGTRDELEELIRTAQSYSLGIIVDLVLHHKTGCPLCNPSAVFFLPTFLASWLTNLMASYNLRDRPELRRFGCYDWGPPLDWEDPALFDEAVRFLVELLEMGISGFRFDAAKHIKPEILRNLIEQATKLSGVDADSLINYSEVLDHQPSLCEEYILLDTPVLTVSDYPRTFFLKAALSPGGDLRSFVNETHSWWSWKSVCLADSHDSIEGNSYSFFDHKESVLAIGTLLALGSGTPLIYHSFLESETVRAGIHFFHNTFGMPAYCAPGSTGDLLILGKGGRAMAIVNKSTSWADLPFFQVSFLQAGRYFEVRYKFEVIVSEGGDGQNWISNWGGGGRGGFTIGPRDILFLCMC
jgi:alpha-amylase